MADRTTPTVTGRPRAYQIERLALAVEGLDHNQFATAQERAYLIGVRNALAWCAGLADVPVLPMPVEGSWLAQDVRAEVEP